MHRLTGSEVQSLMEAYNSVYAPQELTEEQIWEEIENWVNSLIDEGYDLSEYTWDDLYECYITEIKFTPSGGMPPTTTPRGSSATSKIKFTPLGGSSATSTGVSGLSAADRSAYSNGGGNAAAQRGMGSSIAQVIAQGKKNLERMDQGLGRGDKVRRAQDVAAYRSAMRIPPTGSRFVTTTPRGSSATSTGVSGLSAADRSAYSNGGGNAAAQRGMGSSIAQVIAQGKKNLERMDQGKPAPPGSSPTSGSSSAADQRVIVPRPAQPILGNSRIQAPRPTQTPAKPTTSIQPPTATSSPQTFPPPRDGLSQIERDTEEVRRMIKQSQARQQGDSELLASITDESYDSYDAVMNYLIGEGYAETEYAAMAIMANMSEEWRQNIIETQLTPSELDHIARQAVADTLNLPPPNKNDAQRSFPRE